MENNTTYSNRCQVDYNIVMPRGFSSGALSSESNAVSQFNIFERLRLADAALSIEFHDAANYPASEVEC